MLHRMLPVDSSHIAAVGYDDDESTMDVEFVGGAVYRYRGVTITVFARIVTAESVGKEFHSSVRSLPNVYPFERIK